MAAPRLVIIGSAGRMGQTLQTCASQLGLEIAATADQGDSLETAIRQGEVVIDFSFHGTPLKSSGSPGPTEKPW